MKNYQKYYVRQIISDSAAQQSHNLASQLKLSESLCHLLVSRGVTNTETAHRFLTPDLREIPSPLTLKGMKAATKIISEAVESKMQVVVHGDYDVDGITGTAILVDFLQLLRLDVHYHLPNRLQEGYGLSRESIDKLKKHVAMPAVLITVDNGISAVEEVQYARELGFKVIVTDHHKPGQEIPQADAIINPQQKDCCFTQTNICGAAVVFFFVMAIRRVMVEQGVWQQNTMPNLKQYLDLVALGTVADVMDLQDINRVLVKAGLEVLSLRQRPGLQQLCNTSGLHEAFVRADDIAFRLAPRINASGRLGYPEVAAKLLVEKEQDKARSLAQRLEQANMERKELEKAALEEALQQAEQQVSIAKQGLVVYGEQWHLGVIGIIASRIVDQYCLPVIVLTDDPVTKDKLKGSGRSVAGIDLVCVLEDCSQVLDKYGGHSMAAGLSMSAGLRDEFVDLFDKNIRHKMTETIPKELPVDMILDQKTDPAQLARELKLMEPFGAANHEPIFLLQQIRLEQVTTIKDHLKFSVRIGGKRVQGIGFFMAALIDITAKPVDLCFTLRETMYRNRTRIEVRAEGVFLTA